MRTGSSSSSRVRRIRCAGSSNVAAWSPPRGSSGSSRTWIAACSGARTSCWQRRRSPLSATQGDALERLPPGLRTSLERVPLAEGTVLIRQDEPPGDVFVLESGRLRVEMVTPEGTRMRLRAVLPGRRGRRDRDVHGRVAHGRRGGRDAERGPAAQPCVDRADRELTEPELAAALHRWLATTLSERLTDTQRAAMALFD